MPLLPATKLADIMGGNLLDGISKIISDFKLSPEDKANLQLQLTQNADVVKEHEEDFDAKLNDIAGENIRAEDASGDKYTERARPSVIWVGLFVIVWNYCGPGPILAALANRFLHLTVPLTLELPVWFWEAWSTIALGYVVTRSVDKAMALPGDSSIKLPFGISIGNKSPGS